MKHLLEHPINKVRKAFYEDYTVSTLKTLIVLWAIGVILVTVFVVDSPWVLAGILAYEILP